MDATLMQAAITSLHEGQHGRSLELDAKDHICDPYVHVFGGGAMQHVHGIVEDEHDVDSPLKPIAVTAGAFFMITFEHMTSN
jgi:hypothetical protein